jgi:hypothetical protein
MNVAAVVALALIAIPLDMLMSQTAETRTLGKGALQAALEHVRRDLPAGPHAIQLEGGILRDTAREIAKQMGTHARERDAITQCDVSTAGSRSCRFRDDLTGAVGIKTAEQLGPDRYQAVVWTMVQMNSAQRSWLYWREYCVDLELRQGRWVVTQARLLTRS